MKMKMIMILTILLLAGCGDRPDGAHPNTTNRCINGVVYYDGLHSLTPAFNPDGSLITCGVNLWEEK